MTFGTWSHSKFMISNRIQMLIYSKTVWIKALIVVIKNIFFNFLKSYSTYTANSICKIFFYYIFSYSNSFKNLGRLIRLNCRNTHFCSNFYNAIYNSLVVIVNCSVIILIQNLLVNKFGNCFVSQVRIYCSRSVT